MTLVVARQVNDDVYIVGDTKFTNDAVSESKQYIGGLKIVLLTPGLCVSFSGNVEIARNAIQGAYDKDINLFDKNLVIEHFLKHHENSVHMGYDAETDFIVAMIIESTEQPGKPLKEIFRIANSTVHWENEVTHIGDSKAFNLFQEVFHSGSQNSPVPIFEISARGAKERPDFDQSLSAAMNAMQGVMDDTTILCVDGIRTVVITEEDQFRYVEYVQVKGKPIPVKKESGVPVSFGGPAEGSDTKHVGMFSAVGHGIFPVYSVTGHFGLIYHPEQSFEPKTYPKCTLEEFRIRVEERISVAHQRVLNYQSRF